MLKLGTKINTPKPITEEKALNAIQRMKVVERKREIEDIKENPFDYERKLLPDWQSKPPRNLWKNLGYIIKQPLP